MLRSILMLVCAAGVALSAAGAGAQDAKPRRSADGATQIASLDGVTWDGAGARLDQLKGKSVLVLTYVTWCPICNKWAPQMMTALNKAIQDKPVVVLAVSTDTPPAKAREYVTRNGLTGSNVLSGYDPQLAKDFGFTNEFFNFAIVGPDGELTQSGNAGYGSGDDWVVASTIARSKKLGTLRFIKPAMSSELKETLWPMELGYVAEVQRSLKRAEKGLQPADRTLLKSAVADFLDAEFEETQRLAAGNPGQRIDAWDKASFLATNFKASTQGKESKKILADLTKDKTLKREISAKKLYDASMQAADRDQRVTLLEKTARQYAGTHYGELAEKAAAAAKP